MEKMTKLNAYGDAILTDSSMAGVIDNALFKLHKYETVCENADVLKSEYEWLPGLNDDELAYQVQTRNDVQNALIELLRFVDEVKEINEL